MEADSVYLGKRNTRQRNAIFDVIRQARGPLSVPEIHARANRGLPGLGVATVYRAVRLLQESAQVQQVAMPDGEARYESADLGHHEHFHCRTCEQVFDLIDCPVQLPRGAKLPGGFVVEDHEMTIYGTCAECSARAPAGRAQKNASSKV